MDDMKFQRLKSYLEGNDICFPSDYELENIFSIVIHSEEWSQNEGHRVERIKTSPLEQAFHDTWLKWNEPMAGINNGNGILQDLFIERGLGPLDMPKWIHEFTPKERWLVATIIQWLGTNVGMGFLHEVFARVDMYIGQRNKE